MVKSAFILCLILSFSARLTAQTGNTCENKLLAKSLEEKLSGYVIAEPLDSKQFYSNDWYEAMVTLKDERIITGEFLRYNGFLDKFIWLKKSTNQQLILNDENIQKVDLISGKYTGTNHFERIKMKLWYDADSVSVFLEVLNQGPVYLYAQRKIEDNQSTNEYSQDYLYFICINHSPLSAVKPRKKSVLAAFGEYEAECKHALKKSGLGINNEFDLIRAIEYLNSTVDFKNKVN